MNEIIVGNIGRVYAGYDSAKAEITFKTYIEQSVNNYGRAAGESVDWYLDGEIKESHQGTVKN